MRIGAGGLANRVAAGEIAAEHPELDEPEGEMSWQRWLEGRQRLETALLLGAA